MKKPRDLAEHQQRLEVNIDTFTAAVKQAQAEALAAGVPICPWPDGPSCTDK